MELKETIIWSISAIILLSITVFGVMGSIAFSKTGKGAAKSFGLMFQRGNFLRIATVVLIVVAVIFLAVTGFIKENGIVAILSGVAGYVLGGLEKDKPKPESNSDEEVS